MDKGKIAGGILSLTLVGLAIGYVVATGYLTIRYGLSTQAFDVTLLAREYRALGASAPRDFLWVNLILAGFGVAALMLSVTLLGDALTRFGTTHWQTRGEMKRNGFFAKPGGGFLLGKLGPPKSKRPFLVSKTFPHALIVAPTGRGKGVGFVIPNLLTYKGSAVVLDVKGENFRETSRFRASMGDKVFRFAPTDWDRPTHRYNPLARIAAMTNPDRQQMELKLTAKLFLQTDNEKLSGLLAGGIDLFVAAGLLAFERGVPTIGEIYRITASGGDKQKEYLAQMLNMFDGNIIHALAAYNAGPGNVQNYGGVPPFAETQHYVVVIPQQYNSYLAAVGGIDALGTIDPVLLANASFSLSAHGAGVYGDYSLVSVRAAALRVQDIITRIGETEDLHEAIALNTYARAELARLVAIRTRIKAAHTQPLSEEQLAMAAAQAAERQFMDFTLESLR